ncbi:ATP-binding cassette domain-containing protein [Paenibacillus tarimensis]
MTGVLLESDKKTGTITNIHPAESIRTSMIGAETVLELQGMNVCVQQGKQKHTLVHNLDLRIRKREMFALVGESGSGKSLTASAIMGLLPNSLHIESGTILYQGENILTWPEKRKRCLRGCQIGYVFQDYQGSFTPFLKIGKQLTETIRSHRDVSHKQAKIGAIEWLEKVGLPAERAFNSYPFQLSGGQLQRASFAAAMMLEPKLLIADEPTTALDVLTGERVLDLLAGLQLQTGCAVLFITHDLRHVIKRADTVAVMQNGRIIEVQPAGSIVRQAVHPYTRMLLKSVPRLSDADVEIPADTETSFGGNTYERAADG